MKRKREAMTRAMALEPTMSLEAPLFPLADDGDCVEDGFPLAAEPALPAPAEPEVAAPSEAALAVAVPEATLEGELSIWATTAGQVRL